MGINPRSSLCGARERATNARESIDDATCADKTLSRILFFPVALPLAGHESLR